MKSSIRYSISRKISFLYVCILFAIMAEGRPLVRRIKSTHEFERLLEKHATETGLPVIADFYSDGCGPCRQIAPVFAQLAKETGQENAVFVKIDTNALHELSSRYQVRSLPKFIFFYNGKKVDQFSGAGAQQLKQYTGSVLSKSRRENVILSKENLIEFYKEVDPSKEVEGIETVHAKCADMNKGKYNREKECVGSAATQLVKRLKDKYKKKPQTVTRFKPESRRPDESQEEKKTRTEENNKGIII